MAYTPATIIDLIRLGGNLRITGSYSPESLKDFASLAKSKNVKLTIKANSLTPATLNDLIKIGQDCLTIEL